MAKISAWGWIAILLGAAFASPISVVACDCVQPEVVGIDEPNRRYVVTINERSEVMIRASVYDLVKLVEARYPDWAGGVSIGFFATAELAGHLQDPAQHAEWAQNYLAEYDQSAATLTLWPAQPARRRAIDLMVVLATVD